MNAQNKITVLRAVINDNLKPLIDNDYVLWDLPYHPNIGDLLIWEGELAFLKNLPYRNIDSTSFETCQFPILSSDVNILLHGGGNVGNLWRKHQEFRLKVISTYPNNRIIIFPQTVYYSDANSLKKDTIEMRLHDNLYVCARDKNSFEILKNEGLNVLLVPDMAFCIDVNSLNKHRVKCKRGSLLVKRNDLELNLNYQYKIETSFPLEVRDWPTFRKKSFVNLLLCSFHSLSTRYPCFIPFYNKYMKFYKNYSIKVGVKFVSSYKEVYTTRLHVAILRYLLGRSFYLFDNSYGKNRNFYITWLNDSQNGKLL